MSRLQNDIYSPEFQVLLKKTIADLLKLVKQYNHDDASHAILKFRSFVNNIIILLQTMLLEVNRWCDSDEQMETYCTTVERMFIVYIPIIIHNILANNFGIQENNNDIKENYEINLLDKILKSCPTIPEEDKKIITLIKNKLKKQRKTFLQLIKSSLIRSRVDKQNSKKYTDFFLGINTLRNYYAHYSNEITDDNDVEIIKKYLSFIIKEDGTVYIIPNDIFIICKEIFGFLEILSSSLVAE